MTLLQSVALWSVWFSKKPAQFERAWPFTPFGCTALQGAARGNDPCGEHNKWWTGGEQVVNRWWTGVNESDCSNCVNEKGLSLPPTSLALVPSQQIGGWVEI
jgi:hypothetical protein